MLVSELEGESSLASHVGTLASLVLTSEISDGWLSYLAASSIGTSSAIPTNFLCNPLFSENVLSPQRTPLPDELLVCSATQTSRDSGVEAVARAPLAPKTNNFVPKPMRPAFSAPIVATVCAPSSIEVHKPKHIAELVDGDVEEPEAKKGPQKKKRCR